MSVNHHQACTLAEAEEIFRTSLLPHYGLHTIQPDVVTTLEDSRPEKKRTTSSNICRLPVGRRTPENKSDREGPRTLS